MLGFRCAGAPLNGFRATVRREWDSNPRGPKPHGFSRAAHLSALPSLPGLLALGRYAGQKAR